MRRPPPPPLPPGPELDALLIQAASGQCPPLQPWPPRRQEAPQQAAAPAAAAALSSLTPSSYSRQSSWLHFITDETIAALRRSHTDPIHLDARSTPSPPASVVDPSLLLPPNMTYDLLIGQVTHLFRSAYNMERLLTRSAVRRQRRTTTSAGTDSSSHAASATAACQVHFIDPFGTHMQITVQPWQQVSSLVQQLQSYIPPHLQGWCQIGVLAPSHLPATSVSHSAAAASAVASPVPVSASEVQPLSTAQLHMTVAHAKLIANSTSADENKENIAAAAIDDPHAVAPTAAAAANSKDIKSSPCDPTAPSTGAGTLLGAGVSSPTPSTSSSSPSLSNSSHAPSLLTYGHLTILLRHAPTELAEGANTSSDASFPASAAASSSPTPTTQVHTFTLPVFGLDVLADVLQRVYEYARQHLSWEVQASQLFAIEKAFSLPLHMLSTRECGGAGGAQLLSLQQSVFSAQLAHIDKVLLVEVSQLHDVALASATTLPLSIRTLTGRQFDVQAQRHDTVAALKERIAAKEALPSSQQLLLFEQRELDDASATLHSYGIGPGAMLQLLLKLRDSPSDGDFHLECGRVGLHPISTDSIECARTLSALMGWSVPPSSKLRVMRPDALASLLLHTRRLLSDTYAAVLSQDLYGHSSRGKAWIDETALLAECQANEAAAAAAECVEDDGPHATRASPRSLKRNVQSLLDDDTDAAGVRLPSSIDLTSADAAITIESDDDEVQVMPQGRSTAGVPTAGTRALPAQALQRRRIHEPNDTHADARPLVHADSSLPALERA